MKTVLQATLALLIALLSVTASAVTYTEGEQYEVLKTPQATGDSGTIEVVELFWYGCPHCYRLEPFIHDWLQNKPADVKFIRLPAILGKGWELLAKAYFTADLLGVLDKIHGDLFTEIHEKENRITNEKQLRDFFTAHGVPPEDFDKMFDSFAVAVKVNNARLMTRRYEISGVPTLVVNGRYSTSAGQAGSNKEVINVLNYLVDMARETGTDGAAATTASQ